MAQLDTNVHFKPWTVGASMDTTFNSNFSPLVRGIGGGGDLTNMFNPAAFCAWPKLGASGLCKSCFILILVSCVHFGN